MVAEDLGGRVRGGELVEAVEWDGGGLRVVGRQPGRREEGGEGWEQGGTQVVEGGAQGEQRENEG